MFLQIVYNSNPAVAPFRKDVVPKKSEYDVQFQNWKLAEDQEKEVQAAGKATKKKSKVSCFYTNDFWAWG